MKSPYALPVFISLSLVLGIVIGLETTFPLRWVSVSLIIGLGTTLIAFFRAKRLFFQDKSFALTAFITFVALGCLATKLRNPQTDPSHYIHKDLRSPVILKLRIRETLKPNAYYHAYVGQVEHLNGANTTGKILLSLKVDSTARPLHVDDRVAVYGSLNDLPKPLNPYQFDYGAYMANKHVLKQLRVSSDQVLILPSQTASLSGIAAHFRQKLDHRLNASAFSTRQIGLIEALLLGQKQQLSKATYTDFAKAGVVHILAVSGLHVGILLFFFSWLFKPVDFLPKGRLIRMVLVIALLWGYAFLVGLSPSILRAVTMFSFLSLGLFFKRRVFTGNMLCLSAVVLLLYDPYFIKTIGFQLSYAAVIAILLFQPKIFGIFKFKNRFVRYLWGLFSVTMAAQFGVLPLSLFYFHQFPGLFLVSNLLILPFLGVLIGFGVVVLVLAAAGTLPDLVVKIYGKLVDLLYELVSHIAAKEELIFRHIHFSTGMLFFSCLAIIATVLVVYQKKKIYVFLGLTALIAMVAVYLVDYQHENQDRRFYVFHKSRHSVLGHLNDHRLVVMTDEKLDSSAVESLSLLTDFQNEKIITKRILKHPIKNYYRFGKQRLLVVDSTGVWHLPKHIRPSTVLLTQSPKINLDRLIKTLEPQRIIADGSNYKSFVSMWQKTCNQHGVSFHYTGRQGAFQLDY